MVQYYSYYQKFLIIGLGLVAPISVFSGLALAPALVVLSLGAFLLFHFSEPFDYVVHDKLLLMLFAFVGWSALTSIWSIYPMQSLVSAGKLFLTVLLGTSILFAIQRLELQALLNIRDALVHGVCAAIVLASVEFVNDGAVTSTIKSLLGDDSFQFDLSMLNRGACIIALMAWPYFLAMKHEFKDKKLKGLIISLVMWFIIAVTLSHLQSLSALGGFLIASIVYLFTYIKGGTMLAWGAVMCGTVGFLVGVHVFDAAHIASEASNAPPSAIHRLYIWEFVADKIKDNMFIGYGMDTARNLPGGDMIITKVMGNAVYELQALPLHPHNQLLQVWLELGLVGLALILAFFATVFKHILDIDHAMPRATGSAVLVSYFAIGLSAFGVWQHWWLAAAFLAAAATKAMLRLEKLDSL